ncbi:MAG: glycosyltransferase, partial [Muribaculaceae bacterium]|nr:glycosyltransferase [Muribaculaceae bacterium]
VTDARLSAPARGTADRPMRFIFLGRICRLKGVYDLVEVIGSNAHRWRHRATFIIGGTGEDQQLAAAIRQHGIADMVQTPGWVDGTDKLRLINSADVMVLPSYIECLPISLLEAMAAAMPSIATEVGGIPEIITHGENGRLIPPVDHQALAAAIDFYLDHPDRVPVDGRNALARAPRFYPDAIKSQLRELYRSILC